MMMTKMVFFVVILTMLLSIGKIESLQPGGQWKLGKTINGEESRANLGNSVAMSSDGNTIAITKSIKRHTVQVYNYIPLSGKWKQIGTDIVGSSYSITLSPDGRTILIGNPLLKKGIAQVYAFDSTVGDWIQVGSNIHGEMEFDNFGYSVAMANDGKTIAISAPQQTTINGTGNVRVFTLNSHNNTWLQVGDNINGEGVESFFGNSIAMSASGKIIAIGSPFNEVPNETNAGFVRLYYFSATTNQWTPMGSDIVGEAAFDSFGFSIALSASGKTIAIGAESNGGNGMRSGHVRVFSYNDSLSSWKQVGSDIDGEATNDFSGCSVAMSDDGKTIAVGALGNDNPNGVNSGHVRIYSYIASTSVWTQIGSDINGKKKSDESGVSLAMSADGSSIIVGAPFSDTVNGKSTGYVRVFRYKPPQDCTVSWRLYNLQNNTIVASLVNGIKVRNPPPCGYANIEAFVPCANTTSHVVTMALYDRQGKLYRSRTDTNIPYFLYGKYQYGNLKAGEYTIQAIVNSTFSPFTNIVSPSTKFTLLGKCS